MISAAIILAGLLQFADALTTIWILDHGGVEKNPVLRRLMALVGVRWALWLKVFGVLAVLAWCWWADFFCPVPWAAYGIATLSAAVVVHNAWVIVRMRDC
jgi:hypothetical protein